LIKKKLINKITILILIKTSILINGQLVSGRNFVKSQLASYFSTFGKTTIATVFPASSDQD